jgi:hypothetical protein
MKFRSRIAADADSFSLEWAPRLLRLFHLHNGDPAIAESLTIQTLAEHAGSGRVLSKGGPVDLLRRALTKAANAPAPEHSSLDPIVRAVSALPIDQRVAIVLFRGLSLDLETVALVTRRDVTAVKRLCTQALAAMNASLIHGDCERDRTTGEPIFRGERH